MADPRLPLPPPELAARVGTVEGRDPLGFYDEEGARLRAVIDELLPPGWQWERKCVLDFGCGAARVLRQFAHEAADGAFWGCDIDRASIAWDRANLSPPFQFFNNGPTPPVALAAGTLDLVWAMSVFTHITGAWSDWLVEMHRLLADDGILIASFLGEGMWEALVGEPYREDEAGMTVLHHWEGADAWVFHSEWWLREHWGRGFDVLGVMRPPRESNGSAQITHSYIALRRRPGPLDRSELERISSEEPRELVALQTSLRLARREQAELARRIPPPPRPLSRRLARRVLHRRDG